jgi:hypothetical protein
MNVMKVKPKVAALVCRPEVRKIEVRVEEADDALRGMRGNHLLHLGERAHDDLHELRRLDTFDAQAEPRDSAPEPFDGTAEFPYGTA